MTDPKPTTCAAKRCTSPTMRGGWSRFCSRHAIRFFRYGHEEGQPVKDYDLKTYRARVASGLARYENTKAVQAALHLSNEILNYRATFGWTKQLNLQSQMGRLRGAGVTPRDLLARVCEHYALVEANPHRFRTSREEDHAISRAVLRLDKMGTWRPNAHLMNYLGGILREELGAFAIMFIRRLQADARQRQEFREQLADFSEVTP